MEKAYENEINVLCKEFDLEPFQFAECRILLFPKALGINKTKNHIKEELAKYDGRMNRRKYQLLKEIDPKKAMFDINMTGKHSTLIIVRSMAPESYNGTLEKLGYCIGTKVQGGPTFYYSK